MSVKSLRELDEVEDYLRCALAKVRRERIQLDISPVLSRGRTTAPPRLTESDGGNILHLRRAARARRSRPLGEAT